MQIVKFSELAEKPWKNGGGVTRDIALRRQAQQLVWRLSMADVALTGPFSDFAGLTRVLTVIDGTGMVLHMPNGAISANYAQPVTFDGATAVTAELTQGPLRDFNLMFDPLLCRAETEVIQGPLETEVAAGGVVVLHAIAGSVRLNGALSLGRGDTALIEDAPVRLKLDAEDLLLRIVIRARA
jgi:uncharacterized protein